MKMVMVLSAVVWERLTSGRLKCALRGIRAGRAGAEFLRRAEGEQEEKGRKRRDMKEFLIDC